jgi:hypothetical protein
MHRHLVALALVIAIPACVGQSKYHGRIVGLSMLTVGTLVWASSFGPCGNDPDDGFNDKLRCSVHKEAGPVLGGVLLGLGTGLLIYNELRTPIVEPSDEPRSTIPGADQVPRPATDDPMLRQLTLQASFAARNRQCTAVEAIARRVESIDGGYRRGGFVADGAIAACL